MKLCQWCKNEIKYRTKQSYEKAKFCSVKCRMAALGESKKNQVIVSCVVCGKQKSVKASQENRYKTCGSVECQLKNKQSLKGHVIYKRGRHLSEKTKAKISQTKIGKLNPMWKNGSGAYRRIAGENLPRVCVECGATNQLEVHHIDGNHRGNNDISNLIVLCRSCHTKIHCKLRNLTAFQQKDEIQRR